MALYTQGIYSPPLLTIQIQHRPSMTTDSQAPPNYYLTVVVAEGEGLSAVEFYKEALAATAENVYKNEDGTLMHAFLKSSYGFPLAIDEHTPKHCNTDIASGEEKRGKSAYMSVTVVEPHKVEDAVASMKKAGAAITHEPEDMFYGRRVARAVDKYGVAWAFSHRIPYDESVPMPKKFGH